MIGRDETFSEPGFQVSDFSIAAGMKSGQRRTLSIERRTSNVQHRTSNIDDALRGVGATTPTSRRLRFIDFKTNEQ